MTESLRRILMFARLRENDGAPAVKNLFYSYQQLC